MKTDMITEDEFKDLTDSLEVVGHYDPSVKDMLTHIRGSDAKWVGLSVEYLKIHEPAEYQSEIKSTNFPDSGRFEKAIREFWMHPNDFSTVIEEMGMSLSKTSGVYQKPTEIIIFKDLRETVYSTI
jgi:hypothetical protein